MLIDRLCSPALIYLAFSIIQLILDMSQGKFKLAIAKLFVCLMFTYLLNVLCEQKLTNLSWIIISLPFLFMGYMALLLVYALGFSDSNGNDINSNTKNSKTTNDGNNTNTVNNMLSVTAFEPFSQYNSCNYKVKEKFTEKKKPIESTPKKAENLNLDILKIENGKLQ